ncbi:glycosyltransferase, partial [Patescibacteria group bacterium]|nr:glycosyltransferase [Patescibacteria group bacterium]
LTRKVVQSFCARHPEIILHRNKKNLGKPKSVNIALRHFPAMDYYTIIDNDTTIKSKNWTTKLFQAHRDWNNQSILGAKTYMDGFPIIKNGRQYLDPWPFWNLAGCFFSFPKKIFKKLGYFFDKSHRSEDADYCRRAYLAGFHWYYVPAIKATVSHYKHHRERMLLRRRELIQMGIRRKWSDYVMRTHQVYYPPRKISIKRLS